MKDDSPQPPLLPTALPKRPEIKRPESTAFFSQDLHTTFGPSEITKKKDLPLLPRKRGRPPLNRPKPGVAPPLSISREPGQILFNTSLFSAPYLSPSRRADEVIPALSDRSNIFPLFGSQTFSVGTVTTTNARAIQALLTSKPSAHG